MTNEEAHRILSNGLVNAPSEHEWCMAFEMAIQALSQEPTEKPMTVDEMEREYEKSKVLFHKIVECEDAISRDMALEKMADYVASGYADSVEDFEEYSRIICQLPSVTQKSEEWIPVSERLPEENKQVLIQYRTRYRDDVNLFDVTSRADYNYWQGIGREIDVIAWMPLPKPYEPQESEE